MDVRVGHKKSWAPKNWCFWTVVWRRLLRVPWIARRSNQSILKEINLECILEAPTLKLKFQYFGHLMWKADWCCERLKVGGEGDNKGWDGWMASPIRWTWIWASSGSWWWTRKPDVLQSMESQRLRLNWLSKNHYILLPKNWCNLAPLTWNFPSKNIGVGCHFLFQGIFPSQGSNPGLLHWRQILYHLSHQRSSSRFT